MTQTGPVPRWEGPDRPPRERIVRVLLEQLRRHRAEQALRQVQAEQVVAGAAEAGR